MKIAVLSGGLSTERDVSIASGVSVCDALRKKGHRTVLLDVFFGYKSENGIECVFDQEYGFDADASAIKESAPDIAKIKSMRSGGASLGENVIEICRMADIVFMALHGENGENGRLQATFDVLGIKYTGSGYLGSAVAMNKALSKQLFNVAGIPTPECRYLESGGPAAEPELPCVVKPCSNGSSIGVSIARSAEEYRAALELAFKYEPRVMAERYISGREFSVGILGGKALPVIEIKPKSGFFDYANKYQQGRTEEICPAELDAPMAERLQASAVKVYEALQLDAYARIDFILGGDGVFYCLEANTLPGMSPASLLPKEAAAVGLSYGDLCEQIIEESMLRYRDAGRKRNGLLYGPDDIKSAMKPMTLEQIAAACGGEFFGGDAERSLCVSDITVNSKKVGRGALFAALKGANRDGHEFIPEAYASGAVCVLAERAPETGKPYILVESCSRALMDIAEYYRSLFGVKVVGITGSVGKTTTKEMIASVLSQKYSVLKTQGNFNNELGVPLTLFRLREYHDIAVVELGINKFGEMRNLSRMARPDVCVINNIGDSHLEFLGDRAGVLRAKAEIFENMKEGGAVYLNGGDVLLRTLKNASFAPVYYGVDGGNAVFAEDITNMGIKGIRCGIRAGSASFDAVIPAFGSYMVTNALAAAAVGAHFGLSADEIRRGIESFTPVGNRVNIIERENLTIIDDSYNANPTSVKAALAALAELSERKVCILGDMKELGAGSAALHEEVGRCAAVYGIDTVICVGDAAKYISLGASRGAAGVGVHYFTDIAQLERSLSSLIKKGDAVLVKASRSMGFEAVVERLKAL